LEINLHCHDRLNLTASPIIGLSQYDNSLGNGAYCYAELAASSAVVETVASTNTSQQVFMVYL